MQIALSRAEWKELERAQHQERWVRNWKRYQAIRLLAQGQTPAEVAAAIGCQVSSVYNWVTVWRQQGSAGLHEEHHGGRARRMDAAGIRQVETFLATDPHVVGEQASEWTVPLLLTHVQQAGYLLSEHTLRRTLHQVGWRWKRPRYELGQPDPASVEKQRRLWSK